MRHRVFAFKGSLKDAQKKIGKVIKKNKMNKVVGKNVIHFKSGGINPIQGYFKLQEDGKIVNVEMFLNTAWWYFTLCFIGFLAFVMFGIFTYRSSQLIATLSIIAGLFSFTTSYFSGKILESKGELAMSRKMHTENFF